MTTKKTTLIIILVLIAGNIFFGIKHFLIQEELLKIKQEYQGFQMNEKIINFTNLFIQKVLKAEGEVSFEDRLKLENVVRDLGDQEILKQWQKFVDSKTEEEAQKEVKNLLELLVTKISS